VLVNGSSGGVGHLTVQMANAFGARVTAVCSGKNAEFVRSLGADQVIAYDQETIHAHRGEYDLIVDTHGNLTHSDFQRMGTRGVVVGFTNLRHMMALQLASRFRKPSVTFFTAVATTEDLENVALLIQEKKVKVHLDKTYSYREIPDAIRYIETLRARGKVAMVWEEVDGAEGANPI
jgi:NADPH:quinone reductase-like Zn-dependent oxidoreductase